MEGIWEMESSENMEEFFKELGVPFVIRKAVVKIKPKLTLKSNGKTWTMKVQSAFINHEITFEPGVEFDDTMPDKTPVKSIISFVGDKMIQENKNANTKEHLTNSIIELSNGKLIQTLTARHKITAKRVFKRSS